MKNLQKGFIVPVLLAIIAVLVIGGGVYIYESKKTETPPVINNQNQLPNQNQQQTNTQTPQTVNQNTSINTQLPNITLISPSSGPVGTVVTLTGSGFTSGSATYIGISESGQKSFNPISISPTKLTFKIPAGITSGLHIVNVFVTAPQTPTSNGVNFTVTSQIQPTLIKKFFDDYRFSVSYPKNWTPSTMDSKPYFSTVNFTEGANRKASILISSDPGQVAPILQGGLGTGAADSSRTKKTEMTVRGLRVVQWDYVNPGDAGSGSSNHTEWVVIKSCNIDTVYVIDDITLFNNFYLVDANGNESGTVNFSLCSMFDPNKPYTEHREK